MRLWPFESISAIPFPFQTRALNDCYPVYPSHSALAPKSDRRKAETLCNYQNFIINFWKYQGLNFDGLVRNRLPPAGGNPECRQGIEKIGFPFPTSEENGLSPDDHVRQVASGKAGGYSGKEFLKQSSTLASSISAVYLAFIRNKC